MADDLRALIFEVPAQSAPDMSQIPPMSGWIGLVASTRGLRLLTLPAATHEAALAAVRRFYADVELAPADPFLLGVAEQVRAYLRGELREFNVELDLRGYAPFILAVWAATLRIPYGQTRTYAWIAGQVGGGPGASQAAGVALSVNPMPLIIPCHRVIGSDGGLHGFAGGLDMKARLLALESGQMGFGFGE